MSDEYNEEQEPQETPEDESPDSDNGDETTENGESEDSEDLATQVEALKGELETVRKDKNGLLRKLDKVSKSKPKTVATVESTERLDKLELRQLDNELTKDQIVDILTIKEAKGYADVSDAYEDPMVQAFLEKSRASSEKQEKINKAIPRTTGRSTGSVSKPARLGNQSKDWGKQIPTMTTQEAQELIADRFGL